VLVGKGKKKPCRDDRALDEVLTELEDRGLVGWDRRANRYDLHPLVRGVVWGALGDKLRRGVYTSLHTHFAAVPMIDDYLKVSRLEDLTSAIELYNTLIGLGRYDNAGNLFYEWLNKAMLHRLNVSRQMVELMEMLFTNGLDRLPRLSRPSMQAFTLNALALGYLLSGQPGRAVSLYRRHNAICSGMKDDENLSIGLRNLSITLALSGALRESEAVIRSAMLITRKLKNHIVEILSLRLLGLLLAARGVIKESETALLRSLQMSIAKSHNQQEGIVNSYLAQWALLFSEPVTAFSLANRGWELAHIWNYEKDFIFAARMQGAAALALHDFAVADERLHHALSRARQVDYAEGELPALIALAELRRQQGQPDEAREYLNAVWDGAARGPYPLFHADALNVLAQLERNLGHREAAIAAATEAYQKAWCDGPPYAYHFGLTNARRHLQELGAPEPELPPFDASKYEPMPDVELNPKDEFYVEISEVDSEV
jgi:tetratricopeptide (TPR) repeat protein